MGTRRGGAVCEPQLPDRYLDSNRCLAAVHTPWSSLEASLLLPCDRESVLNSLTSLLLLRGGPGGDPRQYQARLSGDRCDEFLL